MRGTTKVQVVGGVASRCTTSLHHHQQPTAVELCLHVTCELLAHVAAGGLLGHLVLALALALALAERPRSNGSWRPVNGSLLPPRRFGMMFLLLKLWHMELQISMNLIYSLLFLLLRWLPIVLFANL